MEYKRNSRGYQQFSQAPEVATYSTLEPDRRNAEGLEPVHYAAHQDHTGRTYYGNDPKDQAFANQAASPQQRTNPRRTWIIIGISAAIALAIGIGVGVGVGLSVGKSSSPMTGDSSKGNSSPSSSPSTNLPPSSTSSSVAYGPTTGLAAYSCKNDTQIASSKNIQYYEDCNAAYLTGSADMYNSSNIIANIANPPYTRYTLVDCLDVCDAWNANTANTTPCRAMTYHANLTQAYGNGWGGNCFVKNGRPTVITRDSADGTIDIEHTVSVYMSCLVEGGC